MQSRMFAPFLVAVTVFLSFTGCKTREYSEDGVAVSDVQSVQDDHYIFGMIPDSEDPQRFQFRLCDIIDGKIYQKNIPEECVNPFVDPKSGKSSSFALMPADTMQRWIKFKGNAKFVLVVVGGVTFIVLAGAVLKYTFSDQVTPALREGLIEYNKFTPEMADKAVSRFKLVTVTGFAIASGFKMLATAVGATWGDTQREFAKVYKNVFERDDFSKPTIVNNVLDIIGEAADALDVDVLPKLTKNLIRKQK